MSVVTASLPVNLLSGKVVAVTGASAGVGRAIAMEAAAAGADVALIARSEAALTEVATLIKARGRRALVAPLDVVNAPALEEAVARIEHELGQIDIWVNAAMATVFSPVDHLPPAELKRVTEVTYLGSANAILAVLAVMRRRDRGVVVQVGSALAFRGIPLQAPYCGAKHALRGFIASVRSELLHSRSRIRITQIHLPAVNTPQFEWARTHLGEHPRPVGAVYSPEAIARGILAAAQAPKRDYWLGRSTIQTIVGQMFLPRFMDRLMARMAWEGQFTGAPAAPRKGNLYHTVEAPHAVHGPFLQEEKDRALLLPADQARLALIGLGAGIAATLGYCLGRRLR